MRGRKKKQSFFLNEWKKKKKLNHSEPEHFFKISSRIMKIGIVHFRITITENLKTIELSIRVRV